MDWPTPQDYNEAVQNPRFCFSDAELKSGKPALDPLGLPRPISGAFASVYQMDCPGRRWAVRCFTKGFDDQEKRYSAISERLGAAKLSCMVGFEYITKGILVRGRWYPVVKMEWIDGESISDYIHRNLKQRQRLQLLARQWIDVIASLRKARIAHGDLQHGNVLVSGGVLKLIDYDAMYVPALAGMESHEEGHRNFQHPSRTGKYYHPDLDNFSAWTIFTSISALAIDPGFWARLNAGDECLLFRRRDFEKPGASDAFQSLEKHGNLQLRTLILHFRSIVELPISRIPLLDKSVLDQLNKPAPNQGRGPRPGTQAPSDWLNDHINPAGRRPHLDPLDANAPGTPINGADWLYDHLIIDDNTTAQPRPPVIRMRDRVALWSFLGVLVVMVVFWATSLVSSLVFAAIILLALAASTSILVMGYRATNTAAERAAIRERLEVGRMRLGQLEAAINQSKLVRARLGEPLAKLRASYDKLPQMMEAETKQLDRNLAKMLGEIEARMRKVQEAHEAEIRAIDAKTVQLDLDLAKTLGEIEACRRKARNDHQAAIGALAAEAEQFYRISTKTLEGIEVLRRKAKQDEERALMQINQRMQTLIIRFVQTKDSLHSEEKAEIDRLLQQSRSLHVKIVLSREMITAAAVIGVGEALVERLHAAGVACAADVKYDNIRNIFGFGNAKANALLAWRHDIESRARSNGPSSLSPAEMSRIREKYFSLAQAIEQQIGSSKEEERMDRQQIYQKHVT